MSKIFALSLLLIFSLAGTSQEFPGFRSGKYTGVNSVFFNPANIAASGYRFDINLFSVHTGVGNNQAAFKLRDIGQSFNTDSLKNQVFSGNAGLTSGMLNVNVHGPSLLFNAGKMSFALTTRARSIANVVDMDGKLVRQITDDLNDNVQLPYTISSDADMRMTVNAWSEFGISAAKVLLSQGPHFLKGGATLKYLVGTSNAYVNIARLQTRLDEDMTNEVYLSNSTGRIATGFGGAEINKLEDGQVFNSANSGFGVDLGLVYEYRPTAEQYQFRAGIALLDAGSIRYNRNQQRSGAYDLDITGQERFYLNQLSDKNIDEYNAVFRANPQYFTPVGNNNAESYKVALPTTLQLDVDYRVAQNFYTSLAAQLPVGGSAVHNSKLYSSFTLSPRFETSNFSMYLPLNTNSLTHFNAGLGLRAGPVFFGSGSVLSAMLSSSKQADVYLGLHMGIKKKQR